MSSSDWETLPKHEVLPGERIGDLLIVRPKGDPLGFQSNQFQGEYARVTRLASAEGVRNVLVDLSASKYFGSEMIGALVRLRNAVAQAHAPAADPGAGEAAGELLEVRDDAGPVGPAGGDLERGGVMALSGVSEDMRTGLSVMNVDRLWLTFEDESTAVRKMAHVPASERVTRGLRRSRWPLAVLLVIGLAGLLFVPAVRNFVFRKTAMDDYRWVNSTEQRWRRKLNTKLTAGDLSRAGGELVEELRPIRQHGRQKDLSSAHIRVLIAAERLMDWMGNPADAAAADEYEAAMADARDAIGKESRSGPTPAEPELVEKHSPPPDDVGAEGDLPPEDPPEPEAGDAADGDAAAVDRVPPTPATDP